MIWTDHTRGCLHDCFSEDMTWGYSPSVDAHAALQIIRTLHARADGQRQDVATMLQFALYHLTGAFCILRACLQGNQHEHMSIEMLKLPAAFARRSEKICSRHYLAKVSCEHALDVLHVELPAPQPSAGNPASPSNHLQTNQLMRQRASSHAGEDVDRHSMLIYDQALPASASEMGHNARPLHVVCLYAKIACSKCIDHCSIGNEM